MGGITMTYNNPKRKSSIMFTRVILIGVYLVISIVLLLVMMPYLGEALHEYFAHFFGLEDFILLAFFLAIFILSMLTLLIFYFMKYREMRFEEKSFFINSNYATYGNYNDERRYLEKQLAELTSRLTDSEEKWSALNHLILAANKTNWIKTENESAKSFLAGLGIDLDSVQIDPKMIFVLTPSDQEYAQDYMAVQKACHDCRLQAIRGDDEDLTYGNKNMLTYIIEHILSARIVVANISNRNPNVFYEIGIAHMAGKPTILICRENKEIPFDLQQKYIVFYSSEMELSTKLKDEIVSILAD